MLRITFQAILFILLFLTGCKESKLKKEASGKIQQLMLSLKKGDEEGVKKIYPDFSKFDSYLKSDSAAIKKISINNNIITVAVNNRFTNDFGKLTEREIEFFLKKDSLNIIRVFDSKGLSTFDDVDEYKFGLKTGCISKGKDTTDQAILARIKKAEKLLTEKLVELYLDLRKEIRVVKWEWESGYSGSASGKGIVFNNSTFSIPKLKYKIIYKDGAGNQITSDDGYVSYEKIDAGESRSFTFYTSYVGSASRAVIELDFDTELMIKYLVEKRWTGKECKEFFKDDPGKLKEL